MTKVLRSQPLMHKTDALARPRPRKALQIEAPRLFHDPESDDDDRPAGPASPSLSLRGAFFSAGYQVSPDAPKEIGALVLAAYQGHDLVHVGSVRAKLTNTEARRLRKMLDTLRWNQKKPPVRCDIANLDGTGVAWVYPTLIANITVRAGSEDGMVQHATYEGLAERQDNADVFKLERLDRAGQTHSRR